MDASAVVKTAPTVHEIARRTQVIGQHDHLHAGFFCIGEHLRTRAPGVRGIFRVSVENGFVIVKARQWR